MQSVGVEAVDGHDREFSFIGATHSRKKCLHPLCEPLECALEQG